MADEEFQSTSGSRVNKKGILLKDALFELICSEFFQEFFLIRRARRLAAGSFEDPFFIHHPHVPERDGGILRCARTGILQFGEFL